MNNNFLLKKAFLAAIVVMIIVNCYAQKQCLCTYGNEPRVYLPDTVIELHSGLRMSLCGNTIKAKDRTLYSDIHLSFCSKENDKTDATNKDGMQFIFYIKDTCELFVDGDTITILPNMYLPIGENFASILVPFYYIEFYQNSVVSDKPFWHPLKYNFLNDNILLYSDIKIQKVWHIYDSMKSSTSTADKRLAGLLFMAAISGSEDLERKLLSLKDQFAMDNDTKIYHQNLVDLLALWKNRKE